MHRASIAEARRRKDIKMDKKKTLADLKRDAANKAITLELIERYGESGDKLPERCRGVRRIARSNTVALTLVTDNGKESELRYDAASLIEYTEDTLTVFAPGYREATPEERKVKAAELALRQKRKEEFPLYSDYWAVKAFYEKSDCPWMWGNEVVKGKKYDWERDAVMDSKVRGEAILKYRVRRTPEERTA